jgi:phosphoserine phosphatase RsbU/P
MKKKDTRQIAHMILVVDDDHCTAYTIDQMLQMAGFDTVCAHTIADAEKAVDSYPISLILLDVHLPDGNGLEFCRKLSNKASTKQTPVLFISSNNDVVTKIEGFTAGGVDYIAKPLSMHEVIARVRTHLRLCAAYESLAHLYTERIEQIATNQQSMMPLPEELPPEANFQVCVRQAFRAGGDFYDVISSGNRITDYVVADASGHNVGVSLWTASFKTLLTEYASAIHTPLDICRMLDNSLQQMLPEGTYFSALYARLNRTTNKVTLVNAGHPSAILVSCQSQQATMLEQEGDLIGVFPDSIFGVREIPVQPGDRLFLYSDGLIESDGSRQIGSERLRDICQSTADMPIKQAVEAITETLCTDEQPDDDIILMGICV